MTVMRGGTASQGNVIGILMPDAVVPRTVGDVGNAFTYDFPVRFHTMRGIGIKSAAVRDESVFRACLDGARYLINEGCRAIALGCSGLMPFGEKLAAECGVFVIPSAVIQAQILAVSMRSSSVVGVMTDAAGSLSASDYTGWGLTEERVTVCPMKEDGFFASAFADGNDSYVYEDVEADVVNTAERMIAENPNVCAIVCEGACFAPFSHAISKAVELPVFDIVTLIRMAASGLTRGLTAPFRNELNGGSVSVPPAWCWTPEYFK